MPVYNFLIPQNLLIQRLASFCAHCGIPDGQKPPEIELEMPKESAHGDVALNLAMKLARVLKKNPLAIARQIEASIREDAKLSSYIATLEIKPPGFINITFSLDVSDALLGDIMAQGEDFGSLDEGKKKKVQIEFVSANPTGPLSIAHGRQAAVGDALAHILEFCGYQVVREYYLNDEGTQIELLGESLRMRYAELAGIQGTIPENGYKGSYLIDIARVLFEKHGESLLKKDASTIKAFFEEAAVKVVLEGIKKDLDDFGVSFDIWFSQKAMTKRKEVEKVLALLKEKGFTYEKEGALWFKSTAFGDDKDRVLIKSDGNYTYISPDIAYHFDKFSRGFTKVVNIWRLLFPA